MSNIWKDFAEINNMSQDEFFSEVVTSAMAMMSMKLDSEGGSAIKVTKGEYTLMLIDNSKDQQC